MNDIMLDKESLLNYLLFLNYTAEINKVHPDSKSNITRDNAFNLALFASKKFFIDITALPCLSPEFTANKIGLRKMAFDQMMILNTIPLNKETMRGLIITKIIANDTFKESINGYCFVEHEDGRGQIYRVNLEIEDIQNPKIPEGEIWTNEDTLLTRNIRLFICNFLDFLNNPEIEYIEVNRTPEQNEKRIKRGKTPIPNYTFVKVMGQLKIYLNELNSGKEFEYSHRFWVRAHYRTLRSDKWKFKKGTRIWIPCFIKGKGLLIEKPYLITKRGEK